jgi:hypothetical protein
MNDYNFVNDPVNPNYIIVVKLNAVDENFANVKKNIVKNNINKEFYTKLSGEVIYLWEHLRPIVAEIKSKLDKKLSKDAIKNDYNSAELIDILDGDRIPTYQQMKNIIRFFHDICYHANITKPRSYVVSDPRTENMLNK